MRAGIALGSNVGDRLQSLCYARSSLFQIPNLTGPILSSPLYETDPVDSSPSSERFLNAVVEITFTGEPVSLLAGLQAIESNMGRPSRRPRNAPRIIDLDILYIGNLTLFNPEILIPHPRLHLRRFVLTPLSDIRPNLLLPGQTRTVSELLSNLSDPAAVDLAPIQWPSFSE